MLAEITEIFKNAYDKQGDDLILSNYNLKPGSYLQVNDKGEVYNVFNINRNTDQTEETFNHIKALDYHSNMLNSNKCLDKKKKIHNNNLYTFFVKKENLSGVLTYEIIDNFYEVLAEPYIKYTPEQYKEIENSLGKVNVNKVMQHKEWIKDNIFNLIKEFDLPDDKSYLKIFFDASMDDYIKESNRYILPNIFNSSKHNVTLNNTTYGVPNNNMTINVAKPSLINLTRKINYPNMITQEEALLQKKLFDYLLSMCTSKKKNIYINDDEIHATDSNYSKAFNGYLIRVENDMSNAKISDFMFVNKQKDKNFIIEDIFDASKVYEIPKILYDKEITFNELISLINVMLFRKKLLYNLWQEDGDMSVNKDVLGYEIIKTKQAYKDWFYAGNENLIRKIFEKSSMNIVSEQISNGYYPYEQMNLIFNLINYFKGVDMGRSFKELYQSLRKKLIDADEQERLENDNEFWFAAGQLVRYLLFINRGRSKKDSLLNPFLNAKTCDQLKDKMQKLFEKYNFDIHFNSKKFKKMYILVFDYKTNTKVNKQILTAGFMYENVLLEKNEVLEEKESNNEKLNKKQSGNMSREKNK